MKIKDYVGKRCLLKVRKNYSEDVQEYKVLEISPSENWVKLQSNYSGQKFWKSITDISFVEELKDFENNPDKKKK